MSCFFVRDVFVREWDIKIFTGGAMVRECDGVYTYFSVARHRDEIRICAERSVCFAGTGVHIYHGTTGLSRIPYS